MVLTNYVILEDGKPSRLHFVDHQIMVKEITDPLTGRPKPIQTLQFQVDELNGQPVVGYYSISSQKHAQDFAAFLVDKRYLRYNFTITVSGSGFRREYLVRSEARS